MEIKANLMRDEEGKVGREMNNSEERKIGFEVSCNWSSWGPHNQLLPWAMVVLSTELEP